MKYVPYRFSLSRLLTLSTCAAFGLLMFQPLTKTIADSDKQPVVATRESTVKVNPERVALQPTASLATFGPQITIPGGKSKRQSQASKVAKALSEISKLGPMFPTAAFSMSDFVVQGFVQGKWPCVIEYELEANSTAEVKIMSSDAKLKFSIRLGPTNGKRKEVKAYIPETFGQKPQLGLISFKALKNGPEPRAPADFFIYGLGFGDKAVGSLVIVRLQFQPGTIRPKLKEKASYSFRSLSDFNKAAAEVRLVTRAADGSSYPQLVYKKEFTDGMRVGETRAGEWDGKNSKGKPSIGTHQFHVRAWRGFEKGGDWAAVSEKLQVKVEQ